jgi:hypothetical protein
MYPSNQTLITRYIDLCEDYNVAPGTDADNHAPPIGDVSPTSAVMLVESNGMGQTWITLWPDAQSAGSYHVGQEYAEDWGVELLIDLITGEMFTVDPIVTADVSYWDTYSFSSPFVPPRIEVPFL